MSQQNYDADLYFLVTTTGIRFLEYTYEAERTKAGYTLLKKTQSGTILKLLTAPNRNEFMTMFREELHNSGYEHILGIRQS